MQGKGDNTDLFFTLCVNKRGRQISITEKSLQRQTFQICPRIILREWKRAVKTVSQPHQLHINHAGPLANIRVVSSKVGSADENEWNQISSQHIIQIYPQGPLFFQRRHYYFLEKWKMRDYTQRMTESSLSQRQCWCRMG